MKFGAVQDRILIEDTSQYTYKRSKSSELFNYMKRFPLLPSHFMPDYVECWDFDSFNLHKIRYETEPNLPVFAYLLVPRDETELVKPGILALHQHNDEFKAGKSETIGLVKNIEYTKTEAVAPNPKYRGPEGKMQFAYARELCERGYIVLAPDLIGFEEYRDIDEYYDEPGFIRGFEEMISAKYILYGTCLMAKHLHDLYVAVSVLASIKGVDSDRIAVIGHSLGGLMAIVLAAFDQRIKTGSSSCGVLSYNHYEQSNRMESAETMIPNLRLDGKDSDFFLDMIHPTPFHLSHDARENEYLPLSKNDNFQIYTHNMGHSFPDDARMDAYEFLS
ncbi:MAG: acetylxylan esterase, partial [Candidatus Thorarchaeota archaeon]